MTLSEFKAWFEGFSEGIDKAPTEEQFAKIKAKVALIDGAPITERIYIDRYVSDYRWWRDRIWQATDPYPYIVSYTSGGAITTLNAVGRNDGIGLCNAEMPAFDGHAAMRDLGRAEAMH